MVLRTLDMELSEIPFEMVVEVAHLVVDVDQQIVVEVAQKMVAEVD